jgi:hypothetical protein
MPRSLPLLDNLSVASPCHAVWDDMEGTDRVRFCDDCRLHVYNLSELSKPAAERLVARHEGQGRLCVRFFRRADGTVLTRDCPRGLAALRWGAALFTARMVGMAVLACGLFTSSGAGRGAGLSASGSRGGPLQSLQSWLTGRAPPAPAMMGAPPPPSLVMGDIAPPEDGQPGIPPPQENPVEEGGPGK